MVELDEFLGTVVDDKYRLERLLGKGGMGAVYLATHLGTERPVAVKLITPRLMQNEEFVRRFSREAKAAGRLRHPNVVDVTDFGIANSPRGSLAYLVMEYLDGCTLADILAEEKQLPLEWAADIVSQTASAVQEAHNLGIVHRDLKPDNIWLEPNRLGGYRVKVLDFGLAKLAEVSPPSSAQGVYVTTETRQSLPDAATIVGDENAITLDGNAITLEENLPTAEHSPTIQPEAATKAFGASAGASSEAATIALATDDGEAATIALEKSETDEEAATQELSAAAVAMQAALMLEKRGRVADVSRTTPASATALDGNVTRVGSIIGTPLYMSPEQCRGERLGVATDIYSLGVITYQMLSGETPFVGNSLEILRQHRSAAPASIREKNKKVPRKIARLVMSALEKDPAHRPPTIEAFADMFRANAEGVGELLQRGMAIFSERFTTLMKISLLVHLPLFLITGLMFLADGLKEWGYLGDTGQTIAGGTLSFASFIGNLVAASLISGVTILFVLQLSIAPLRRLEGRAALRQVKGRLKPLLWTTLLIFILAGLALGVILGVGLPLSFLLKAKVSSTLGGLAAILFGVAALVAVVVVMVRCSLAAPVVLMEEISGRAALRRSSQLVGLALSTVLMIQAVQWLVPITASTAAQFIAGSFTKNDRTKFDNGMLRIEGGDSSAPAQAEDENQKKNREEAAKAERKGRAYRAQVAGRFAGWLNVLLIPLLSIINALLYLKLRQIAGESPKALMDSFENAEMPTSRWQQRMRERVAYSAGSYRNTSRPPSSGISSD